MICHFLSPRTNLTQFLISPKFGIIMRFILIIALMFSLSETYAQDKENETTKPSWSEEMPEMLDAPEMDVNSDLDTDIDLEIEGLDRRDVFNDSDDDSEVQDFPIDLEENSNDEVDQASLDQLAEDQAAAEQLAKDQAAAEQLAKDQAAAEQLAKDQAAAEQLAKDQAAAEQLAKDQAAAEQLVKDQAAAEQLAKDQAAAEQLAKDQSAAEQLVKDQAAAEQLANDQAAEEQFANDQDIPDSVVTIETPTEQLEANSNQEAAPYNWYKVNDALPRYPSRAARSNEEGWVEVNVEINPNGDVVNAIVADSFRNARTFHKSAISAVKQWKFDPPINYGINENQFKSFRILFKL